jgi:hypothetical protein
MNNSEPLTVTMTQPLEWWSQFIGFLQDAPFRFAAPIIATTQQTAQQRQQEEQAAQAAANPSAVAQSPLAGNGMERTASPTL